MGALRMCVAMVAMLWAGVAPALGQQTPPPTATSEQQPKEPIPPITEADRQAAFPPGLEGHDMGGGINFMVLFDQLEWRGRSDGGAAWEHTTWIGGDINRLWVRVEGDTERSRVEHLSAEALWGHSVSRWWDVVVGVAHDRPGPDARTWAAVGVQGLAPQWFEIELTGYVGDGGRTRLRGEVEYEMLLTNRWILQPLLEVEAHGKADTARGIAAGLSSLSLGARLRYAISPEFAPYVGVTWERSLFGTADLARAHGDPAGRARLALGVRAWF